MHCIARGLCAVLASLSLFAASPALSQSASGTPADIAVNLTVYIDASITVTDPDSSASPHLAIIRQIEALLLDDRQGVPLIGPRGRVVVKAFGGDVVTIAQLNDASPAASFYSLLEEFAADPISFFPSGTFGGPASSSFRIISDFNRLVEDIRTNAIIRPQTESVSVVVVYSDFVHYPTNQSAVLCESVDAFVGNNVLTIDPELTALGAALIGLGANGGDEAAPLIFVAPVNDFGAVSAANPSNYDVCALRAQQVGFVVDGFEGLPNAMRLNFDPEASTPTVLAEALEASLLSLLDPALSVSEADIRTSPSGDFSINLNVSNGGRADRRVIAVDLYNSAGARDSNLPISARGVRVTFTGSDLVRAGEMNTLNVTVSPTSAAREIYSAPVTFGRVQFDSGLFSDFEINNIVPELPFFSRPSIVQISDTNLALAGTLNAQQTSVRLTDLQIEAVALGLRTPLQINEGRPIVRGQTLDLAEVAAPFDRGLAGDGVGPVRLIALVEVDDLIYEVRSEEISVTQAEPLLIGSSAVDLSRDGQSLILSLDVSNPANTDNTVTQVVIRASGEPQTNITLAQSTTIRAGRTDTVRVTVPDSLVLPLNEQLELVRSAQPVVSPLQRVQATVIDGINGQEVQPVTLPPPTGRPVNPLVCTTAGTGQAWTFDDGFATIALAVENPDAIAQRVDMIGIYTDVARTSPITPISVEDQLVLPSNGSVNRRSEVQLRVSGLEMLQWRIAAPSGFVYATVVDDQDRECEQPIEIRLPPQGLLQMSDIRWDVDAIPSPTLFFRLTNPNPLHMALTALNAATEVGDGGRPLRGLPFNLPATIEPTSSVFIETEFLSSELVDILNPERNLRIDADVVGFAEPIAFSISEPSIDFALRLVSGSPPRWLDADVATARLLLGAGVANQLEVGATFIALDREGSNVLEITRENVRVETASAASIFVDIEIPRTQQAPFLLRDTAFVCVLSPLSQGDARECRREDWIALPTPERAPLVLSPAETRAFGQGGELVFEATVTNTSGFVNQAEALWLASPTASALSPRRFASRTPITVAPGETRPVQFRLQRSGALPYYQNWVARYTVDDLATSDTNWDPDTDPNPSPRVLLDQISVSITGENASYDVASPVLAVFDFNAETVGSFSPRIRVRADASVERTLQWPAPPLPLQFWLADGDGAENRLLGDDLGLNLTFSETRPTTSVQTLSWEGIDPELLTRPFQVYTATPTLFQQQGLLVPTLSDTITLPMWFQVQFSDYIFLAVLIFLFIAFGVLLFSRANFRLLRAALEISSINRTSAQDRLYSSSINPILFLGNIYGILFSFVTSLVLIIISSNLSIPLLSDIVSVALLLINVLITFVGIHFMSYIFVNNSYRSLESTFVDRMDRLRITSFWISLLFIMIIIAILVFTFTSTPDIVYPDFAINPLEIQG